MGLCPKDGWYSADVTLVIRQIYFDCRKDSYILRWEYAAVAAACKFQQW